MTKMKEPPINSAVLESICKVIADTSTGISGPGIGKILGECKIPDVDPNLTKWKRLYNAFVTFQNKKQLSNNILTFIQSAINPARYIGKEEELEDLKHEVNKPLSFIGLESRLLDQCGLPPPANLAW